MASQDKPNVNDEEYNDTNEMKYMWIAVGVIVMVIWSDGHQHADHKSPAPRRSR